MQCVYVVIVVISSARVPINEAANDCCNKYGSETTTIPGYGGHGGGMRPTQLRYSPVSRCQVDHLL
jgi:hypothetical protein